jgi:hypothetical protein
MNTNETKKPQQVGRSVLNDGLDGLMYKPQKGEWKLTAPDGTVFVGESPIRCVKAEIDYRVPTHVQLQRLFDALDEDEEYDA